MPLELLLSREYAQTRARADRPHASADCGPVAVRRATRRCAKVASATPNPRAATPATWTSRTASATSSSATPSGGWLQSSPAIDGLGFALGTRAQMFWLEEGLASSLKPGVRPRTTLSPSMAVHDDGTVLAFGTPGGDQQDQWSCSSSSRTPCSA